MANEEHLKRILEGIDAWNLWRDKNPGVKPDLSGADLVGQDLIKGDLSNTDLSGAILRGARLAGVRLDNSNLDGADLTDVDMRDAQAAGANFVMAIADRGNFSGTNFSGAKMDRLQARRATFNSANFAGVAADNADFSRAIMGTVNLVDSSLREANLSAADLPNCNLLGADLLRANLKRSSGLNCSGLQSAKNWESSYRDVELACHAPIPTMPTKKTGSDSLMWKIDEAPVQSTGGAIGSSPIGGAPIAGPVAVAGALPGGTLPKTTTQAEVIARSAPRYQITISPEDVPPYIELKDRREGPKTLTDEQLGELEGNIDNAEELFGQLIDKLRKPIERGIGDNNPPPEFSIAQLEAEGIAAFAMIRAPIRDVAPYSEFQETLKELQNTFDSMGDAFDKLKGASKEHVQATATIVSALIKVGGLILVALLI